VTPATYEQWRHCIEVQCGIKLTPDFVQQRLSALRDNGDYQTQRFLEMWGEPHLDQVVAWFEQARLELEGAISPSSSSHTQQR
jgi:hypothetical protein